jgi:hypothetical protein
MLAAELVAGEDVAGGGDGQQLHEEGAEGEDKGVGVRLSQSALSQASRKLSSVSGMGQQGGHILAEGRGAKRGRQHP